MPPSLSTACTDTIEWRELRMYAIGIKDGVIRCGNDGMVKLNNTSPRKIMEQTEQLRRKNDAVYIVSDFTQAMCEMPPDKLLAYIARTGRKIK